MKTNKNVPQEETYKGLYYEPTAVSINEAIKRINEERSGEQHGLYCRWDELNHLMLRYWRFKHVTMIAGMSGSGKSYFLNMLRQDFLDTHDVIYRNIAAFNLPDNNDVTHPDYPIPIYFEPDTLRTGMPREGYDATALWYPKSKLVLHDGQLIHKAINKNCVHDVICIHFGYEMDAADELLRGASSRLGKSYGFLMSSEWDKKLNEYARVTDIDLASCQEVLESFRTRKEFYIPSSGNLRQLYWTVEEIANKYPNCKLVVSIDHLLLSRWLDERSDMELISNTALTAIDIRQDFDAMVIPLMQLNQNIEKEERILKPALHYPGKNDIHYGAAMWWACDNVIINHRPKVLNIRQYGLDKLETKRLLHSVVCKSRKGKLGNVWLEEDFDSGRIHSATKDDFKATANTKGSESSAGLL